MITIKSVKTQLIVYLAATALFLVIKERNFVFLRAFAMIVFSAILSESLISYFKTKKFQITESSIITGMIIGYVISSDEPWWKLTFTAVLAIFSKYLIVFKKKHIFNPAAFGMLLSMLILGVQSQWKTTYMWYVLVPVGLYFAQKIKKIEIITGYAITSLVLFGTQAILQKVSLSEIFWYFSYFYIFVMVIEPKTTPFNTTAKYIFGTATAGLIFVLTQSGIKFDVELFSLLAMNITVPLLNKIAPAKGGSV